MPSSDCFNAVHVILNVPCAAVTPKKANLRIRTKSFRPNTGYVKAAVLNLKITSEFLKKRANPTIFSGTTGNGWKCGLAGWHTSDPSIDSESL